MKCDCSSSARPGNAAGAVQLKNLLAALVLLVLIVIGLRAVLHTVKETTTAVSDRNTQAVEQRKTLVKEQTERIKSAREAQEAP